MITLLARKLTENPQEEAQLPVFTCELPFYVGKVGRTGVADGEAWGRQALVAIKVNQISRDR